MGTGRLPKLARGAKRGSSDCGSDPRDSAVIAEEHRGRRYVRKALEFGVASGYLIPVEGSGRRVLRVSSDIEQFAGGGGGERGGSEGRPDLATEGRGRSGRGGRAAGGGRLIAKNPKNEQKNVRKRGRSRTKSPRKPAAQKRRKKRSESLAKPKPGVQKRRRAADGRNEPSGNGRGAADDEGGADDEDDEPDPDNDEDVDNNSDEKKNKLPVTSRPGSIVPNSDERASDGDKKTGDDETSDPSGEEGSTGDEEEEAAAALRQDEAPDEDANEDGREQNANVG